METIIAGLVAAVCGLGWKIYKMTVRTLIKGWARNPTGEVLCSTCLCLLFCMLLLNLCILLFRCLIYHFGGEPFFPTFVERTPSEWIMAAVLGSLGIYFGLCSITISIYAFVKKTENLALEQVQKILLYLCLIIGVVAFVYQLYFYWWAEWRLSEKLSYLLRLIPC